MSDESSLPPPPPHEYREGHPPPPPATDPLGTYAGWWRRFGGRVVDTIGLGLVVLVCLLPMIILFETGDTEIVPCYVDLEGDVVDDDTVEDLGLEDNALCEEITDGASAVALAAGAVGIVPYVLFLVWWYRKLGRTGKTWGKQALGMRLVDANTGEPIGGGRAFGREIVAGTLSAYVLGIGFLWAAWDKRKQTWHDKIITTVVVRDPQ
ncbi:MAG TPA: RDD family protein [Acidimicrobiales bacterium]|nr:RDD family protein [Acidimicrobiales bacterium]